MAKFWEVTKSVFALIGLAILVAGLTILVVVMGRKKDETITLAGVPYDPMDIPGVQSALDAGKERMAALFQRIRMGKSGSAGLGGDGTDGQGGD